MAATGLSDEELITLALEAISDRSPERLRPLLADEVRIVTDRATHEGVEPAIAWSAKGYEHLDRRYAIERIEPVGSGRLVAARVEYVWRESGEVGDSSPAFFAVRIAGGRLTALSLHDEEEGARRELEA